MSSKIMNYVIDTSVYVDYIDIIPDPDEPENDPLKSTIDFTGSRIIIPNAVTRELGRFKDDNGDTHRKRASRILLDRISRIFSWSPPTMGEIFEMGTTAETTINGVTFVTLPVDDNFVSSLPIKPDPKDGDGNILVAALAVAFIDNGLKVDGSESLEKAMNIDTSNVALVTNDNEFAIFAWSHGIRPLRYHYEYQRAYTGIRELLVPKSLLYSFWASKKLTLEEWRHVMPDEPRLIANEFIVMKLADPKDYPRDYREAEYSNVGRFDAKKKAIVPLYHVRQFPILPKGLYQAVYMEALLEPSISAVICTGTAGSGKTFLSVTVGIAMVMCGHFKRIILIPCKEDETFGYLPGDLDNKLEPYIALFKDAISGLIECGGLDAMKLLNKLGKVPSNKKKRKAMGNAGSASSDGKVMSAGKIDELANMIWNNYFKVIAVKFAQGRTFSNCFLHYDEFQLQNIGNAAMLIDRLGVNSKLIITGDLSQIDSHYSNVWDNGITYAMNVTQDNPRVARVFLTADDIGRNPLVKEIARRREKKRASSS